MSILTRVQSNPEISTDDGAYVADLIERAKAILKKECRLPVFPELAKGYSKSVASATENNSGLLSNELLVEVNGIGPYEINPTLTSCGTGANTATELQTVIRVVDADGFDEVTVAFATTQYTITSGRYGEASSINVTFREDEKHVAQSMGLSPVFGGTEVVGAVYDAEMEDAAVMLTEILYRKLGVEGTKSGHVPGGLTFTDWETEPNLARIINNRRRAW